MLRWLAYALMALSLGASVVRYGGVLPWEWEWSALGLGLGALLWVALGPRRDRAPGDAWGVAILAALLGWMLFQLMPLPPGWVAWLSPERWNAVAGARATLGEDPNAWTALSVAPASSFQRLLFVLPAMAAFVAAREMAWWWRERLWLAIAPVVVIAWLESLLGLVQFYFARMEGGLAGSSTGTYVSRNNFSGLLEVALPIALTWSIATWRHNTTRHQQPARVAVATAFLLTVAASILMGVVLSLSRMGFISIVAVTGVTGVLLLASVGGQGGRWSRWRWAIPAAVLLLIVTLLPTREMILRFADLSATEDVSQDTRVRLWEDALTVSGNYRWPGCGLGAYEECSYLYQTATPAARVDYVHNDYLQIFAEEGLVGAALLALLAGWCLWRPLWVVVARRGGANWEFAIGTLGALLTIGLHSLTDFNLYIPANAAAVAWIAGVAASPGLRD